MSSACCGRHEWGTQIYVRELVEAGFGPEGGGGDGGDDDEGGGEDGGPGEVDGQGGDVGVEAEGDEDGEGAGEDEVVPPGAGGVAVGGGGAGVGLEDAVVVEAVAGALALEGGVGGGVLALGGDGGADGERTEDHDGGAEDDVEAMGEVGVGEFAEDERAPGESPELVGVGERDAAADADVLGGVLLEDVSDDPDEAAEEEPEDYSSRFGRVCEYVHRGGIERECEDEDGGEFADGEDGDEGERAHAADVGLAVGDVHGSPDKACSGCGEDAADSAVGVRACAVDGAEAEQDGGGNNGQRTEDDFGGVFAACAFELAEEQAAPEDADEGVGVPEGKGDGEADVSNGEDGEGVGDGPEHAGEDGGGNEVRVLGEVGEDLARAFEERGDGPAGSEDSGDHAERDGVGREAGIDELGRRFSRAKPYAGGESAEHADAVDGAETGVCVGGWHQWSVMRSATPRQKTTSGMRK